MGAIAERLVLGGATAAERHAVAHLEFKTVRGHHGDAAPHPERAVANSGNRRLELRFDRFSGSGLQSETARRSVGNHTNESSTNLGVARLLGHVPDAREFGAAETGVGAERDRKSVV